MADEHGTKGIPETESEASDAESRWGPWTESTARRWPGPEADGQAAAEPFQSPRAFRIWSVDAARGLLDVQFHQPATRTLLPLAYMLGLVFAIGIPITLTVLLWHVSAVLGVIAAVIAVPLGLTIAAVVRLLLEFLVSVSLLAGRVEHISELADDLHEALANVAEPVNQLSEDVRAVQFWRFRGKGSRK